MIEQRFKIYLNKFISIKTSEIASEVKLKMPWNRGNFEE